VRWLDALARLVTVAFLLAACAPRATEAGTSAPPSPAPTSVVASVRAAFSDRGVVWVTNGRVFLARAPGFQVEAVRTPGQAADAAWHDGDAWAALPAAGWVQRVTGRPDVVQAGRAYRLTATRVYREDGSAVTYTGAGTTGMLGAPDAVVTGGDGLDYALQSGRLYKLGTGRLLVSERAAGPYLSVTPEGAVASAVPAVTTREGTYRVTGGKLQRVDPTGVVRSEVTSDAVVVGRVGDLIVTVSPEGVVRAFRYDLSEVKL